MSKTPQLLAKTCAGMHVCFVGGPCLSGKTTYAGFAMKLLHHLGLTTLDMSDIVRGEMKENTKLGRVFKKHQKSADAGGLQPDEEIMQAVAKAMDKLRLRNYRYVFMVGAPRTEAQANIITDSGINFSSVHITADENRLRANLARRQRAGHKRPDDKYLERRLSIYQKDTVPAMGWLALKASDRSVEIELNANMTPLKTIVTMIGVCTSWNRTFMGEASESLSRRSNPVTNQIATLA